MMKITSCLLLLGNLLFFAACATKDPYNSAREINEECIVEMEAARTAIHLRDKGKTQQEMAATLPPLNKSSSRLLVQLHQIIEESYRYPALNEVIYPTYRFELCVRQLTNKPYPADIKMAFPTLMGCQQQYGRHASTAATQCVTSALDQTNLPASN
jgi:hypothetical protein